jgi:hypothetical protein
MLVKLTPCELPALSKNRSFVNAVELMSFHRREKTIQIILKCLMVCIVIKTIKLMPLGKMNYAILPHRQNCTNTVSVKFGQKQTNRMK